MTWCEAPESGYQFTELGESEFTIIVYGLCWEKLDWTVPWIYGLMGNYRNLGYACIKSVGGWAYHEACD